jgi:uncharacterized protein (TIGR00725 family)
MKIKLGVMASAEAEAALRLKPLLTELGAEIARRDLVLLTGATTGVPDAVSRAAREAGCLTLGISPAHDAREHTERYHLPVDGCDALLFTGFGLKGRNVVLVRSSDIVLVVAGGMGTLNEFTIAVDEGKVVGVLSGTGGIADEAARLLAYVRQPERVLFDARPGKLLDQCLARCLS